MLDKLFNAVEYELKQDMTPLNHRILMEFREEREEANFSTNKTLRERDEKFGGLIVSTIKALVKRISDLERERDAMAEERHANSSPCFVVQCPEGTKPEDFVGKFREIFANKNPQ